MKRRLYRSSTNSVVGGVCGGLGDYLGIDPVVIRLLFIFLAVANGLGVMLYVILWIVLPEEERVGQPTEDVIRDNIESLRDKAEQLGDEIRSTVIDARASLRGEERSDAGVDRQPAAAAGVILIGIGAVILLTNLGLFWWLDFGSLWPLLIAGLGVFLLVKALREGRR